MNVEKVILALKIHAEGCGYKTDFCTAQGCPYAEKDYNCDIEQMCSDAVSVLKEQKDTINELQNAYGYLQKQFFEVQDKLLKEQEAVEPKTGHWIWLQFCANEGVYCSDCHTKMFDRYPMKKKLSQFCGHCGAKMDDEVEGR